ncbi:unnamed protein product [Closterium sp. NIES-53]
MAAQELRWLTYLLTDLGEAPRSPPVLYVDNKAMLALCQEHRTKHIALRYFLARELQKRGQLCLAYVASQANTADVFTKALQPCDHQPAVEQHRHRVCLHSRKSRYRWKSSPASDAKIFGSTTPTIEQDAFPSPRPLPLEESTSFVDDVFFNVCFSLPTSHLDGGDDWSTNRGLPCCRPRRGRGTRSRDGWGLGRSSTPVVDHQLHGPCPASTSFHQRPSSTTHLRYHLRLASHAAPADDFASSVQRNSPAHGCPWAALPHA